ncbi:MAG: hypothetical protein FWC70_02460 [Defluviitaleaceae bacterium]|nr:hypothetical protein [Defluviitaleaceae bacterium]
MIEQHFYTRGRHGYDTVAQSPGLSDDFVKKNIRPYCVYGGADAITLAHLPCGKMLFGKTTRRDFKGQRAAFFMHNFIFPPEKVGEFLAEIEKYLHTPFETSYDGGELCAVEHLPSPSDAANLNTGHAFSELLVKSALAKSALAHRAGELVRKSKKMHVLTEADPRDVIAELYKHLPEEVKHRLGFCTAAVSPENRKNVHLIFLKNARFPGNFTDLSNPSKSVSGNSATDFASAFEALTPEKFFAERAFWIVRTPHLHEKISLAEVAWLEKNIDTFTARQILAIPQDFIKRGKNGENPALYVQLSIMKSALKNREIPSRYLLGSYALSPEVRERIEQKLRVLKNSLRVRAENARHCCAGIAGK